MTDLGVRLRLDAGDFISGAGRARDAMAALSAAMEQAEQEGRADDYGKLAYERERLRPRVEGFERDIRSVTENPRFQTQGPHGAALKIDGEYLELIKRQIEAMSRLAADYEDALKSGDIARAQNVSPRLERQQEDFHKIVSGSGREEAAQAPPPMPADWQEQTASPPIPPPAPPQPPAPPAPTPAPDILGGFLATADGIKNAIRELDKK
jgi:hypothetical protein